MNDPFAEVEYGQNITPTKKPQRLPTLDATREKIYDMRSLAPDAFDQWRSPKLFYRQAKFMEDFEDSFEGEVGHIGSPNFSYQDLGTNQLRGYFSFRTQIRQGDFVPKGTIPSLYVKLLLNEYIYNIGAKGPVNALGKIMDFWNTVKGAMEPAAQKYFVNVVMDYHLYYPLPHSFRAFVSNYQLYEFFSELLMPYPNNKSLFNAWLHYSTLNPKLTTKDISDEEYLKMRKVFCKVVPALKVLFDNLGTPLEDIMFVKSSPAHYSLFSHFMFESHRLVADKEVVLTPGHVFTCKNGQWTHQKPIKQEAGRRLTRRIVGEYIKIFRHVAQPQSKVTLKRGNDQNARDNEMKVSFPWELIDQTMLQITQEALRETVAVAVDTKNLTRIRAEAEITQEKLIVEETLPEVSPAVRLETPTPKSPTPSPDNPWTAFKSALTPVEATALKLALQNPSAIPTHVKAHHTMLEILADAINEKAMDTIGDNVLEAMAALDTLEVYPEYAGEITNLDFT